MTRNLKILGASCVIALALSAMTVSTAAAQAPFWFKSDGSLTVLVGDQELVEGKGHTFTFDGGTLVCSAIVYRGTQNSTTASKIRVEPEYISCAFSGLKAEVHVNGCEWVFHTDTATQTGTPGGKYDVITTIECPEGKDITITVVPSGVTKCVIHIPPQSLGTGITLTNATDGIAEDITADISFSNITYTQTKGSFPGNCLTTDETHNGTFNGKATFTGTNLLTQAPTSIWLE